MGSRSHLFDDSSLSSAETVTGYEDGVEMAPIDTSQGTEVRVTVRLAPVVFEHINDLRVGARRGFNPQLIKMIESRLLVFTPQDAKRVDIDLLMNATLRHVPIRLPVNVHGFLAAWAKRTGLSLNTLINVVTYIEARRQLRFGEAIAYRIMAKHLPTDVMQGLCEDAAATGRSMLEQAATILTSNYICD